MKTYKKLKIPKSLKKQLDELWTEIIKKRAGYKSELSGILGKKAGGAEVITAHHIVGKPNNRLRYELENGICLINGAEHIYGVHNKFDVVRARDYQDRIIKTIGQQRYIRLLNLRNSAEKVDLKLIRLYLENELKKL